MNHPDPIRRSRRQRGFTLVELMIAVALGMLVMIALVAVYLNVSRTNSEMYKTNGMIENGRFAIDVLNEDLTHAGFWGGYVPRFDDYSLRKLVPADLPTAAALAKGPCAAYADWDADYRTMLIGVPVQAFDDALPTGCDATLIKDRKAGTDVLVVRHADTCVPGSTNCEAFNANKVYYQMSRCANEIAPAPPGVPTYYDLSKKAAVANFVLTGRRCAAGPVQPIYKFVSNIYYIRTWASTEGDNVPTLVRSTFGVDAGGLPAHEPAQALIEGIEEFRVELGRDTTTRCGGAIDYTKEIRLEPILLPAGTGSLVDPSNCLYNAASAPRNTLPLVRGDGMPDSYIRCPAAGCTFDQLRDIVAVKMYLVARSKDQTPGYTDTKTYSLGSAPAASYGTDATKFYKRHQFQTTVRLTNVSGRRETPI